MSETETIAITIPNFSDKETKSLNLNKKEDANTSFLKAARLGNLTKVQEFIAEHIDINTSNSNGLNALHLASKEGHFDVVKEVLSNGASVDACTKKGNTALHIASLAGHVDIVKLLVEGGADVNLQSSNGFTPLYMASQENHIEVVEFLLQHGALQTLATEDGFTPLAVSLQQGHEKVVALLLEHDGGGGKMRLPALHIAAKKDDIRAAKLLLQNNSEKTKYLVNDITKSGFTPLHIAAHYGNNNVGNLLIEFGAEVNFRARNLITPLHISSKWGRLTMVVLLLEHGAQVDPQTRDGLTPMHCAARSGHHQVVEALLKRGAKVEMKTVNGLTPLHMAIQGDHEACANILLLHNSAINEITVDYLTPLHVAAHCGNVKTAKLLLQDKKCEVNARALNGFTPLHIACKKNRVKVVELLLRYGATIEATTESGLTPLHVASFMGHMNIVVHLIQHSSNPNTPTCRGETSLHLAARANQTDIIRVLLRNGAVVNAKSWDDQTTLHVASRLGNVDNVVLLLRHGASPNDVTKDSATPLHLAAREGHLEVVNILLDHGAKKEMSNKRGFTPLHLACKHNHAEVVKVLLGRECDCNVESKSGITPLLAATLHDHPNIVSILLEHKASPTISAKNGFAPLHIAAKKNRMEIASALLEAGVPANAEIHNGLTPLDLACQQGHVDMVQLLLENSADANHRAAKGVTALHLAAQEDKVLVAPMLVQHGAVVNAQTKAGYTPLHTACHFGQMNMIEFLLQQAADINATTKMGYTPLHHAAQQGHIQVVDLLLKNQASPNILNNFNQSPMSIAHRLGYVSIVELLRPVSDEAALVVASSEDHEKVKVVLPEVVTEPNLSESEDESVEDMMTLLMSKSYDHFPRGYDSIDSMALQHHYHHHNHQQDKQQKHLDNKLKQQQLFINNHTNNIMETSNDSTVYVQEEMMYMKRDVQLHADPISWICNNEEGMENYQLTFDATSGFLVSFMVDARGGLYRGCRHSGLRVVVPPNRMLMPVRVMCKLVKRDKIPYPPPLMKGEALAGRVVDLAPYGIKLNGPVLFEVPHSASLDRGREIVVLRSDDGHDWRMHTPPSENHPSMESFLNQISELNISPTPLSLPGKISPISHFHIITDDIPRYFALVTRIKMETRIVQNQGEVLSSKVVPLVQVVIPEAAVDSPTLVGLQTQEISPSSVVKMAGNRVAVAPLITIEPQNKEFMKPVTITTSLPTPAQKGMINQYGAENPSSSSLKLLTSSSGVSTLNYLHGKSPNVENTGSTNQDDWKWQDITQSTPLKLQDGHASFSVSTAARYWLVDCPKSANEMLNVASEIFKEMTLVPFLTRFLVFAKRLSNKEAILRVVICSDGEDFEGKNALESQEKFKEIARSKVVEVLENKPMQVEMSGNLSPVSKSDEQLSISHNSCEDSKLTFYVRVKDVCQPGKGIFALLPLSKGGRTDTATNPVCCLSLVLPETTASSDDGDADVDSPPVIDSDEKDALLKEEPDIGLNLRAISNLLQSDWLPLANELKLTETQINEVQSNHEFQGERALAMLYLWADQYKGSSLKEELTEALKAIGRDDIIALLDGPIVKKTATFAEEACMKQKDYLDKNFDALKDEIGSTCEFDSSRGSTLQQGASLDVSYDDRDLGGGGVVVETDDDSDAKLRYVSNYNPQTDETGGCLPDLISSAGDEESSSTNVEESMETMADGRKMKIKKETTSKIIRRSDGEEIRGVDVVENITILGIGVKEPYDVDDVSIEVSTDFYEQTCDDGSSMTTKSSKTIVDLKEAQALPVEEDLIIPSVAAERMTMKRMMRFSDEYDDEGGYDDDDDDGGGGGGGRTAFDGATQDVSDDLVEKISVFEEPIIREEKQTSEFSVDVMKLDHPDSPTGHSLAASMKPNSSNEIKAAQEKKEGDRHKFGVFGDSGISSDDGRPGIFDNVENEILTECQFTDDAGQ